MDCNNFCQEEINKILQNNKKMKDFDNKGKTRTYTEKNVMNIRNYSNMVRN